MLFESDSLSTLHWIVYKFDTFGFFDPKNYRKNAVVHFMERHSSMLQMTITPPVSGIQISGPVRFEKQKMLIFTETSNY